MAEPIKTVELFRDEDFYSDYLDEWDICAYELRKYFRIPKHALKIWMVAYKHPSPYRVQVTFDKELELLVDGYEVTFMSDTEFHVHAILERSNPFYAECWYEEEA